MLICKFSAWLGTLLMLHHPICSQPACLLESVPIYLYKKMFKLTYKTLLGWQWITNSLTLSHNNIPLLRLLPTMSVFFLSLVKSAMLREYYSSRRMWLNHENEMNRNIIYGDVVITMYVLGNLVQCITHSSSSGFK